MPARATTGITTLSLVTVMVSDQDRSIAFYEGLGLDKKVDIPFGGTYRWVEMYVGDDATGVALAPPPAGVEVTPQDTGIVFASRDLVATHADLREQGVDVDAEIMSMGPDQPVPDMFWLRDPDGHRLLVVQQQG